MKELLPGISGILLAIIGVAVVAVIVSKNAQTANVITAGGNAFSQSILCALGPVIGGGNCGTTASEIIKYN